MIIWNFKTPITFLASCIWNLSESAGIGLGNLAPIMFGLVIGAKPRKIKKNKEE